MPQHKKHQQKTPDHLSEREFILNQPPLPDDDLARRFIFENPRPPTWGSSMERALRGDLTAAGFTVTYCDCMVEHPVIRLRMRGPAEMGKQDVARCIRKLARALGHRVNPRGMVASASAGRIEAAFAVDAF